MTPSPDTPPERQHEHRFVDFHADYCHKFENGVMCADCRHVKQVVTMLRDFSYPASAWWHWGKAGCIHCEELMRQAGLDPAALGDEELACAEIQRRYA